MGWREGQTGGASLSGPPPGLPRSGGGTARWELDNEFRQAGATASLPPERGRSGGVLIVRDSSRGLHASKPGNDAVVLGEEGFKQLRIVRRHGAFHRRALRERLAP